MSKTVVHLTCQKCRALIDAGKQDFGKELACTVCGTKVKVPTLEELRTMQEDKGKLNCPHCAASFTAKPEPGNPNVLCPECGKPVSLHTKGMSDSGTLWAGGKPPAHPYWTSAWEALVFPLFFINKTAAFLFGVPLAVTLCVFAGRFALLKSAAAPFAATATMGVAVVCSVAAIAAAAWVFSLFLMIASQPLKALDTCPSVYGQRHTDSLYKTVALAALYLGPAFVLARNSALSEGSANVFEWGFASYFLLAVLGALAPMGLMSMARKPGSNGLSLISSIEVIRKLPGEYFYLVMVIFVTVIFHLLFGSFIGSTVDGVAGANLPPLFAGLPGVFIRTVFLVSAVIISARSTFVFARHFQAKNELFKAREDAYRAFMMPRLLNIIAFLFIISSVYSMSAKYISGARTEISAAQAQALAESLSHAASSKYPENKDEFVKIAESAATENEDFKTMTEHFGFRPVKENFPATAIWAFETESMRPDGKLHVIKNNKFKVEAISADLCDKVLKIQKKLYEENADMKALEKELLACWGKGSATAGSSH